MPRKTKTVTDAELAVLSLLAEKKISWLKSVLESGEGKGPARQIYSLTTTGRDIWKRAVITALSHPHRSSSNFQLGLSNLLHLEKEQIISALEEYVNVLEQKYQQLMEKFTNYGENLPWNASAMFDLSFTQIKTELDWVKAFIEKINLIAP